MAEIDVEALRGAIDAYAAAVAASNEAMERRWAIKDLPLREMGAARDLLPLLTGLPEQIAAWQRVAAAARPCTTWTAGRGCSMTADELGAIEARANAATPGPWEYAHATGQIVAGWHYRHGVVLSYARMKRADGIFIVFSRQDVPALVARVRELEAEHARLRAVADEAREVAMHDLDNAHLGPDAPERGNHGAG